MALQIQTAFNVWYLDDGTFGGGKGELLGALRTIQQGVWDAFCTDTISYCASSIGRTSSETGLAAARAESQKTKTYSYLCRSYCFVPVSVETSYLVHKLCLPSRISVDMYN